MLIKGDYGNTLRTDMQLMVKVTLEYQEPCPQILATKLR